MEKQRWEASEKRSAEERRSEKRKSEKKEDAGARKGSKVACGSGGSKSRLAKAAGAEPSGQMRDEKLYTLVARSKFPSQIAQNTPCSEQFWKLICRKSARRCGAEHIWKLNCAKHYMFGALEVDMSKKCTPLWREANFQVKTRKAHDSRTIFGS